MLGIIDIIDYIRINFSTHAHQDITLKVLDCINYIETNINTVAELTGKQDLFRHPDNKMAVHLRYSTEEETKDQLLKLAAEVRGCFNSILSINNEHEQRKVMSAMLDNINDSATGCMEARLRPALMFYATYQSTGYPNIAQLMREFDHQYKNPQISDVIDYFSMYVEHHMPVMLDSGKMQLLNWDLVKDSLIKIFSWDTINDEWKSSISELTSPRIIKTGNWRIYSFESEQDARRYLSYIKSILPDYESELAKAEVRHDEFHKNYSFKLTVDQLFAFNQTIRDHQKLTNKKTNKGKDEAKQNEEIKLKRDENLLFPKNCNIRPTANGVIVEFSHETDAETSLSKLKELLGTKQLYIQKQEGSTPSIYQIQISSKQWRDITKQVRSRAPVFHQDSDFVIKSLRVDENNYFRRFVEMIASPYKKHPLRKGSKKSITVTGRGVFQRKDRVAPAKLPIKQPQFTSEEKKEFSKTQSSSLGFHGHHPNVFGFKNRAEKLVGVMIEAKNVLFSDRLYLYDGGTVGRPYDFLTADEAHQYHQKKVNTTLFNRDNLAKFKDLVKSNIDKYNEAMVRMRWGSDGTSKFFVASDSLPARLWAQEYARIMREHLLQQKMIDKDDVLPICYYIPENIDLHLKEYTATEQQLDNLIALELYKNDVAWIQYFNNDDYEILFSLPPVMIVDAFKKEFKSNNLILTIMSKGYFHIIQSLLEKAGASNQAALKNIVISELKKSKHRPFLMDITYHAIRTENTWIVDSILNLKLLKNCDKRIPYDKNPLTEAADKGYVDYIKPLYSATYWEDRYGHAQYIIDAYYNAAARGHVEALKAILPLLHGASNNNRYIRSGRTPFMMAIEGGHVEAVKLLLPYVTSDGEINFSVNDKTAISLAVECGRLDVIKVLLTWNHIYFQSTHMNIAKAQSPLLIAAKNGYIDIFTELLSYSRKYPSKCADDLYLAYLYTCDNGNASIFDLFNAQDLNNIFRTAIKKHDYEGAKKCLSHPNFNKDDLVNTIEDMLVLTVDNTNGAINSKTGEFTPEENEHLNIAMVKYLMSFSNININHQDKKGYTALMRAVKRRHTEMVKTLLSMPNIDVNCKNAKGKSAFHQFKYYKSFVNKSALALLMSPQLKLNLADMIQSDYSRCLELSMDKDYASALLNYLLNQHLPDYSNRRENEEEFKHAYGKLFGTSKDLKLKAVSAILNNEDLTPHKKALSDGELKRIYTLLENCRERLEVKKLLGNK